MAPETALKLSRHVLRAVSHPHGGARASRPR